MGKNALVQRDGVLDAFRAIDGSLFGGTQSENFIRG
jgi:hypothetical protein